MSIKGVAHSTLAHASSSSLPSSTICRNIGNRLVLVQIFLHLQRCSENNRASILLPSLLKMINGMVDHQATLVLYTDFSSTHVSGFFNGGCGSVTKAHLPIEW